MKDVIFTLASLTLLASFPLWILALITPRRFSWFFQRNLTRGKITQIFATVLCSSFVVVVATSPTSTNTTQAPTNQPDTVPLSTQLETRSLTPHPEELPPSLTLNPTFDHSTQRVDLIRVIDGDTLSISIDGTSTVIRIIGINTPETVDPRKPVECFGKEASDRAKELLTNQTIYLKTDPTQDNKDRYGRLLRYVFLSDNLDYGKRMIEDGYAYEYTYDQAYESQSEYRQAQTKAQQEKRGLWSEGACSTTPSTVPGKPDTLPLPSLAPDETTTTQPLSTKPQTNPTTSSCFCESNRYNCSDFSTHDEAQALYACCLDQIGYDIHRLDGNDNDGLACESLP